jgi:hypothetical protein
MIESRRSGLARERMQVSAQDAVFEHRRWLTFMKECVGIAHASPSNRSVLAKSVAAA